VVDDITAEAEGARAEVGWSGRSLDLVVMAFGDFSCTRAARWFERQAWTFSFKPKMHLTSFSFTSTSPLDTLAIRLISFYTPTTYGAMLMEMRNLWGEVKAEFPKLAEPPGRLALSEQTGTRNWFWCISGDL
jgi:hypothetical protein